MRRETPGPPHAGAADPGDLERNAQAGPVAHGRAGGLGRAPTVHRWPRVWGLRADSISQAFERVCKSAEVEGLTFHDLRHEATSRLFEKGLNPMEVAAITGTRPSRCSSGTHISGRRILWSGWGSKKIAALWPPSILTSDRLLVGQFAWADSVLLVTRLCPLTPARRNL